MRLNERFASSTLRLSAALLLPCLLGAGGAAWGQCPSRVSSTLGMSSIIDVPVTVEKRPSGGSFLIIFSLDPDHAFTPGNPCTTADGVIQSANSTNIANFTPIIADDDEFIVDLNPAADDTPVTLCFRVNFEENYNINGNVINPKKKKRSLSLPALNDLTPGQIIHLNTGDCGSDD